MSENKEKESVSMRDALGEVYDKMEKGEPETKKETKPEEVKKEPPKLKEELKQSPEEISASKKEPKKEPEKEPEKEKTTLELKKEETDEPKEVVPIEPEEHWSDADKKSFLLVPPENRGWFMERYKRLEADNNKKSMESASLKKFRQEFDDLLDPYKADFKAQGMDDISAIRTLLGFRDQMKQNPAQGLQALAQKFGVDLSALNQAESDDPQVNAINKAFSAINEKFASFEKTLNDDKMNTTISLLDKFSNEKDEKGLIHPHFDAVMEDMTKLMNSGMVQIGDLQSAYDKALLLHPELKPANKAQANISEPAQIDASDQAQVKKSEELEKAAAAAKAKKAATGVTGDGGGKSEQKMTLREELTARMDGSLH